MKIPVIVKFIDKDIKLKILKFLKDNKNRMPKYSDGRLGKDIIETYKKYEQLK